MSSYDGTRGNFDFRLFQDIDRLDHYGQLRGQQASQDVTYDSQGQGFDINPATFFSADPEKNTEFLFHGLFAKEKSYEEYRRSGVHRYDQDKC